MLQIKRYRKIAKLTQSQLGELVGATKGTVYSWETGLRTPSQKYITKLCEIFNITIAELYGEIPTNEHNYSDDVTLSEYIFSNELACVNEALMNACTMLTKQYPSKSSRDIYTDLLFQAAKRRTTDANSRSN